MVFHWRAPDQYGLSVPEPGVSARAAIAGRRTGHDAAVRQRDAAGVHEVRSVPGEVAVDDDRVAELEVALLEAAARQRAGRAGRKRPVDDGAGVVFRVEVEVDVRVGPFDLDECARNAEGLLSVEFRRERVVRERRNGGDVRPRRSVPRVCFRREALIGHHFHQFAAKTPAKLLVEAIAVVDLVDRWPRTTYDAPDHCLTRM